VAEHCLARASAPRRAGVCTSFGSRVRLGSCFNTTLRLVFRHCKAGKVLEILLAQWRLERSSLHYKQYIESLDRAIDCPIQELYEHYEYYLEATADQLHKLGGATDLLDSSVAFVVSWSYASLFLSLALSDHRLVR
jgi:hypothetical protein